MHNFKVVTGHSKQGIKRDEKREDEKESKKMDERRERERVGAEAKGRAVALLPCKEHKSCPGLW